MADPSRVPHNLRQYVVEQDYAQYTEIDQAVWRFVLLQTYQRLAQTAHPAYKSGLGKTGISVERIPRITEMSACLERFGWSAVCVDGFIPPRAFQEFQAASILPIAADMRALDHLKYTPAPDIIHEAAGHAPILPDAGYAAYLRAIGEVGKKAFSSPEDARVYAAIFELSEVKETRGVPAPIVAAAEARLVRALADVSYTSEASRLSRLYWWTAEYGLVGTPRDYKLYGAGLLSSLWESHACHDPAVQKLPLTAACVEQAYDITRTQPQLYVARDFEQLFSVLQEVDASLAYRVGGDPALAAALKSEELATVQFQDEGFLSGQLCALSGHAKEGLLSFRGRLGHGSSARLSALFDAPSTGYRLPVGPLSDGTLVASLTPEALAARYRHGVRTRLRFACGAELEGELEATSQNRQGQIATARFKDYVLHSERGAGFREAGPSYLLCAVNEVITAQAGAIDPAFFPESEQSSVRVPKPRTLAERERALLALYERAVAACCERLGSSVETAFSAIHGELNAHFGDEWLLRWNLLESLCKLGERGPLARTLEAELAALEIRFSHREPIATGLRYLSALAA
ncbi:MAG TPA: aromatic amino acid hydroxylase [Polyangiaceae bacterium]|jgi:phenylalanine-4-hydroxylase|nr:aromatic amino acid hydroxylase [Polyangiaceae bacterium]